MSDAVRVIAILADCLEVPIARITTASDLEELGCDGLCRIDLAMRLETEFEVSIPDELAWITVQDVVDGIAAALAEARP